MTPWNPAAMMLAFLATLACLPLLLVIDETLSRWFEDTGGGRR